MADLTPQPIASQPGCQRDGTVFDGESYSDNQWCRYHLKKGRPRKMGGMRVISNQLSDVCRGMNVFNQNNDTYTHCGSAAALDRLTIDQFGNTSATANRASAGFVADANNTWQFGQLYDGGGIGNSLIAHAAPNLLDISSGTETEVSYGSITGAGALVATGSPNVSGGVMSLGPFGVSYGNAGIVNVSAANDVVTAWAFNARPTGSKIVYGLALRGGAGNGPSALLFSLDALIRMTFVGGTTVWNFDTISGQYSLLSSQCVIENDGIFYWVGIDSFKMYNGVIQELDNTMNQDWFFDNLNMAYRQKVFVTKVTRYGEIWWCYPRGDATECTHAVIYNYRLSRRLGFNVWYDTELPAGARSAAQFAQTFHSPLMTGTDIDVVSGLYSLWQHEYGYDVLDSQKRVLAIQSYFKTANMALTSPGGGGGGKDRGLYCKVVQPDFVQTGSMIFNIFGQANPRAQEVSGTAVTFADTATDYLEQLLNVEGDVRQLAFYFESNVAGGFYQMGNTLAYLREGSGKMTS